MGRGNKVFGGGNGELKRVGPEGDEAATAGQGAGGGWGGQMAMAKRNVLLLFPLGSEGSCHGLRKSLRRISRFEEIP